MKQQMIEIAMIDLERVAQSYRDQEKAQIAINQYAEASVWCNRAIGAEAVIDIVREKLTNSWDSTGEQSDE